MCVRVRLSVLARVCVTVSFYVRADSPSSIDGNDSSTIVPRNFFEPKNSMLRPILLVHVS